MEGRALVDTLTVAVDRRTSQIMTTRALVTFSYPIIIVIISLIINYLDLVAAVAVFENNTLPVAGQCNGLCTAVS